VVTTWWNLNCAENENIPVKNWKEMGSTQDIWIPKLLKSIFKLLRKWYPYRIHES